MKKRSGKTHIGIGTDIESISRFTKILKQKNSSLIHKIYTESEIKYCFSKINPAAHFTARFAAKEAISKALTVLNIKIPPFSKLEILKTKKNVPYINLGENIESTLSISHNKDFAIAFVVLIYSKT